MKTNNFDLDEMQRLWQKQSRAAEGHSLISEEEVRRAMQGNRKAEVRPLYLWRRVAAVAAVVVVAGMMLWLWPFSATGNGDFMSAEVKMEPLSHELLEVDGERPSAEPAPAAEPAGAVQAGRKPLLVAHAAPQVPQTETAAEASQPALAEPSAPAELPDNTLLAQAEVPRHAAWPNRNRQVDTIVVYTNRLVHFDAPKRKSLSETLFEPLLASL